MKNVSGNELRNVNGGFYAHCTWCCGRGSNVDFYSTITWYLHSKTKKHKKYWNNGYGYQGSSSKCAHTGGY